MQDLAKDYGMHPRTLRRHFDAHAGATGELHIAEEDVSVIMDAFYFEPGEGILLCRTTEENLYWRSVRTERTEDYVTCIDAVTAMGRHVRTATIDGRRGVRQMLEQRGIAVQFCQFHQIAAVKRYIPSRTKTEAARALRSIALRLSSLNRIQCETALGAWHVLYGEFLRERTYSEKNKRRWQYTHRRLRSAYRSFHRNLPCLFTFEAFPHLHIPKTTNHCDGLFSHLKERISMHRGLSRARRKQMTDYLLEHWFR